MPMIAYDASRTALLQPERGETVLQTGNDYPALTLAVEAARLAYVRWETAPAQMARLSDALARVGFDPPQGLGDPPAGPRAFAALRPADGMAIIAFRGTQPDRLADLAVDIEANTVPWPEADGNVHAGFARAARAVRPAIAAWLADNRIGSEAVTLTGHSLGGALAVLTASVLRPAQLVTLGCPRVGDGAFIATLSDLHRIRLVNCCDVVTELPPPIGGYTHFAPATYIDRDGTVHPDPSEALITRDRLRARSSYLIEHAWKIGSVVVRDLADHAPVNYLRAVLP